MKKILVFLLALALLSPLLSGHEAAEEPLNAERLNPGSELQQPVLYSLVLVVLLGVVSAALGDKLGEKGKKAMFWAIAIVTVGTTLYLAGSIVHLFYDSASGGPVHWHADFEVWACEERISLKKAEGWSTRVGPLLLHHHGDDRIHVEGVVTEKSDVALGKFFAAIGGELTGDSTALVDESGVLRRWHDGDLCPGGRPGKLNLFVNGVENPARGDYVISPHTSIPPGDVLKIVFEPQ